MGQLRPPVRIGVVAVAVAVLAYAATFLFAPRYSSYASMYFPMYQQQSMALNPLAAISGANAGSESGGMVRSLNGALLAPVIGSAPQTAIGILVSHENVVDTAQQLKLADAWNMPELKAVAKLKDQIAAGLDKNGFLVVEAISDDPKRSQEIVRSLIKGMERRSGKLTINVSRKNRQYIEDRIKRAKDKIAERESELTKLFPENFLMDGENLGQAYWNLRLEYERLTANKAQLQQTLEKTKSMSDAALAAMLTDPGTLAEFGALQQEFNNRRLRLADALSAFTETNPELKDARRSFSVAERLLTEAVSEERVKTGKSLTEGLTSLEAQVDGVEAASKVYAEGLTQVESKMRIQPIKSLEFAKAQRNLQAANQLLTQLEAELENALIAESRDPSRFEIVDAPFPAEEPIFPRRLLTSGLAFALALCVQIAVWALKRPE